MHSFLRLFTLIIGFLYWSKERSVLAWSPSSRSIVHSFCLLSRRRATTNPQQRIYSTRIRATTDAPDNAHVDNLPSSSTASFSDPLGGREIWLDLRGTVIAPKEAIRFLGDILSDGDKQVDISHVVRRILVNEAEFLRELENDGGLELEERLSILYTAEGNVIAINEDELQQSIPFGAVVSVEADCNIDPIYATEIVLSRGQWLLIEPDTRRMEDSFEWMIGQIASLYDFLVTSSTSGAAAGPGGLILPSLNVDSVKVRGGMAISVPTKSKLVQVDSTLTQSSFARQMLSSKDSDLMLPSGVVETSIPTALVLPFDADVWRILLDMYDVYE